MIKRNKLISVIFFVSVAALFIYIDAAPKKVVYWGSIGKPETLDPGQAWYEASIFFTVNIFDTLVRLNPETAEIVPSLAVSWEAKNNGKSWMFRLRKGVRFHDGTEFNAEAVVFSFKRQMDKNFPYRYYDSLLFDEIFGNIKSVVSTSPFTVVFHLKEPFFPFLATLTSSTAAIVSPAAVQKYRQKFYQNPVGTGAFMFKSWEKKKRIVLVANPHYWRGKPAIDEFVSITSDKHEILHKLFRQEKIDIIDSISISRTAGLKNLRWATIKLIPTLSVTFIAFNFKNKNLKKENIRKAIRFAWDPRFLKYVFQDFVVPLNSILPRGMPGYKTEMRTKNFFINKARELVEKENITGVIKLRFLLLNDSSLERQIVSLFSKNLKRIGIELELESVSREKYKKRIGSGDFDLTFSGWIADYPDPHSIISPLFNDQLQEKGFANLSQYKDANIKAQIESIASEVNTPKRIKKVAGIIQGVYDHVLCIPIFQDTTVIVYNNKKIKNIIVSPINNISLFDIEKK